MYVRKPESRRRRILLVGSTTPPINAGLGVANDRPPPEVFKFLDGAPKKVKRGFTGSDANPGDRYAGE
jgi:hypothetical protein